MRRICEKYADDQQFAGWWIFALMNLMELSILAATIG
jgi:hypothetical protein